MQGDAKFEDSLRIRLALMQPSMDQVQRFLDSHPAQLSPGKSHLCEGQDGLQVLSLQFATSASPSLQVWLS